MKSFFIFIILGFIIITSYIFGENVFKAKILEEEYFSTSVMQVMELPIVNGTYTNISLNTKYNVLYSQYLFDYNSGIINYDEFIIKINYCLENNAILQSDRMDNMIRTANIDINSQDKIYMQDNKEKTLTTIFIVQCNEPKNLVKIININDFLYTLNIDKDGDLLIWTINDTNKKIKYR